MAGRRHPADQGWKRTRSAANDDVLRGARFQPDCVDKDVEQDRNGQHHGCEPVGRKAHQQHREDAQPNPEMERRLTVHPSCGQRPLGRPPHFRVNLDLVPLVERSAGAGGKRNAKDCREAEHEGKLHRRNQEPAKSGEDHEAHHARFRQREEIAPVGRQRGWIGQLQGGHGRAYKGLLSRGKVCVARFIEALLMVPS